MLKFNKSFINSLIALLVTIALSTTWMLWTILEKGEIFFMDFQIANLKFATISFVFMADFMSMTFILSVSIISIAVLKFSESYMSSDPYFLRFHFLLMAFIFSMYFLILSPNFISLLLGWDGLGLSSYLLVIYYGSAKAYNSGMITALTNRLGDALILISIAYILKMGSWHIFLYSLEPLSMLITIMIMVAATTKSAQIPFSAWLPAAMAAPTPVSSLVHSSTLVTAGVYLLIRHNLMFFNSQTAAYLMTMGILTMLMASVSALFEMDLKKMVALSTLSQLGVMMLSLGLGAYVASFFHLLTHAFFKALLFLATGSVIHSSNSYQDLRTMGSASKTMPLTSGFILLSLLSLMGLPFMSAFFSKELILEIILINNFNFFVYVYMALGVSLTALYSARFVYMGMVNCSKNEHAIFKSDEDTPLIQSMLVLMMPAMLAGAYLSLALFPVTSLSSSPMSLKLSIVSLIFLSLGASVYWAKKFNITKWNKILWAAGIMWSLPMISAATPLVAVSTPGNKINKLLDRGIFLATIKSSESLIMKANKLSHSLMSLQKILSISVLWGLLLSLY